MKNKQEIPLIGRKIYFKEKRGNNTEAKWYIGKIVGVRAVRRTQTNLFGPNQEWNDNSLLIETSDHRRVQVFEIDTFEVNR